MLNAVGYVIKRADGRYKDYLRTLSIKAEIDILPNIQKTSDGQPDFRMMTVANEFGVGWLHKGETSNREL